jgi:16S rRNA (uracil1498-N3)-methyltransferase
MDQIIRQATEAGVFRIIPVVSDFSVSRLDIEKPGKMDRWNKIIKEAIQQSGSRVNTQIEGPVTIDELAEIDESACINGGIGLFFHQEALDHSPLHRYLDSNPESISLIIGPEGGLSDREIEVLYSKNYKSVYLKTIVLRAETAALYAVSAVQTILLESGNWALRV